MARLLREAGGIVVGSEQPGVVTACKLVPVDTIEEVPGLVAQQLGTGLDVLPVPHALHCLPLVQECGLARQ
jgi:hypothetical protein